MFMHTKMLFWKREHIQSSIGKYNLHDTTRVKDIINNFQHPGTPW